ncbi:MAG: M13 family metallopeptidase [Pseudomonadota bacterium]
MASVALAACGASSSNSDGGRPDSMAAPPEAAKPELGEWGIEVENVLESVDPGDDFFNYVNGSWIERTEIPDEFSSYSSFTILAERSEEQVRQIIKDAAASAPKTGTIEQKIGDFFASFVDVDAINKLGLKPIAEDLEFFASLQTHEDVARAMALPELGASSFIGAYVEIDAKRTQQYSLYITQAGLGMPNRDYYLDDKLADKRPKYKDYIETLLTLAEVPEPAQKAAAILDLETRMAEAHWEPAKRRNRDLTYNLKSVDELELYAPGAPWRVIFEAADLGDLEELIVREDDAIQKLAALFSETPVETWRAYLAFHHISSFASTLPSAFDQARFEFYSKELRGTIAQRERWKRGVGAVNGTLGEAVGQVYVARHFPPESKTQMVELVENVKRALSVRLDAIDWMSEATKVEAREKLGKFTTKIGYPNEWQDYSSLTVVRGDAYGNAKRATAFGWSEQVKKLGGPIDRNEWFINPQTVNAYYSPTRNEIVFPAAILQAPFFDPYADPAVNYGGIGGVIGHEIGHGFDDQGRKSDGDGMLRDWWTEEDKENYEVLAAGLGAQYETYEPFEGFSINPTLTMGENIGDLGGLNLAYEAYKLSLNGEEAPTIDGITGDQRFFLAWGQVWKRVAREEAIKAQVATGPHSPAKYRVNGIVRNMDAWYDAFEIESDDALYLPPEQRVRIW